MALNTKSFTDLVRDMAAGIQAKSSALVDFTVGSVLLAITEAVAGVVTWLQGLIVALLATTRAATSSGEDLDSWMADFQFTRLAATYAAGTVTFSRFTAGSSAVYIPVGTQVQTADGSQTFSVVADSTNAHYDAANQQYVMDSGVSSVNVAVQADVAGAAGNVLAGAIKTLSSAVPGADAVNNAAAMAGGIDAETDEAFRTRFQAYIASLEKATKDAVGYAADALQQNLTHQLVENEKYDGTTDNGYFYVVVDDGTGSPTSTLLSTVSNAIDAARPVAIRFGVFAPVVVNATVVMTVGVASGYDATATKSAVQTALESYINGLTLGETLYYTRLAQVAYDASDGVVSVSSVTLNGGTADLTATSKQVIKYNTVTVN